jgi:hypothetical protein
MAAMEGLFEASANYKFNISISLPIFIYISCQFSICNASAFPYKKKTQEVKHVF